MPQLAERDITGQVRDYLAHRGWRPIRQQRTAVPGAFSTGEPGMPDMLFIWYFEEPAGAAAALWIEFKSSRGERSCRCHSKKVCTTCQQKKWRLRESRRGAVVMTVSDFDNFEVRYKDLFGWLHASVGQQELPLVGARETIA